jgi:hypothetical protein
MKLFWVEDAALKACAQLPDLKLSEVLVLEQYGKTFLSLLTTYPRLSPLFTDANLIAAHFTTSMNTQKKRTSL